MFYCRRRRPVHHLLGARLRDRRGKGDMGKLRTSEVGHSPIPASERDVLRLQCNGEMLLQQTGELIVILDAPQLNKKHNSGS